MSSSSVAAVPEEVHQSLLVDGSDVQTKVGHVAKFSSDENKNEIEDNILLDQLISYEKIKENNQFIALSKEELKSYINDPKWKRIRWIIAIFYLLILIFLLVGSIILIIKSDRCPPKVNLQWYEKEIIYEIDVPTFRDTNNDGIGDIKGIEEKLKLKYFEKNNIKTILLRSSIFNVTSGRSIQLDGQKMSEEKFGLLTIDSSVGNDQNFQDLIKSLYRKDMHLIIDLPLATTFDPNGYSWYGSSEILSQKINNPCIENESNLACRYYRSYGLLPLDFNNPLVFNQSESRLRYWLLTKKVDGVRVNLPLIYDPNTRLYNISYHTIHLWNKIKLDIEKKTKPKLILIDIPFAIQNMINKDYLYNQSAYPLLLLNNQQTTNINAKLLNQRFKSLSKPRFWKLGSERNSDRFGIIDQNQLSKEIVLTIIMLAGGTPIILYGEEIGLDQKQFPLMSWTPDGLSGGFSSCSSSDCTRLFSSYQSGLSKTSVKRQEALGGESQDSLLTVFRRLSKLRQFESFQFGLLEFGYDSQSNLFWFIREATGHRGYVILLNLNRNTNDIAHISLHKLTKRDVPHDIHYEYQWPKVTFPTSNKTHINSDNLLINPQSINIFWWIPKLLKPKILLDNAEEHSHTN